MEYGERPQGGGRKTHLSHPDYFEEINSENKAYWLGYLYADGSVRIRNNTYVLSINVKPSDFYHVERFQEEIGSRHKSYSVKSAKAACGTKRVDICSKQLVYGLISQGCHPKKMYDLDPPVLDEFLIRDFIRGFWDGDGSLGFYGKYNQLHMSATGTDAMINWIHKQLPSKSYIDRSGNEARVRSTSNSAKINLDYLYSDAKVSLNRKRELYERII